MRIKIKFNNNDTLNLKKNKFLLGFLLTLGSGFLLASLTQIICLIFKPSGYEKIIQIGGNNYVKQLLFGIMFIGCYIMIKKSKTTNLE
jgi:hypothetical protein